VAAWQQVQQLAFAKAKQQHKAAEYDAFIQVFMPTDYADAELLHTAIELALDAERQRIIQHYLNGETEPTQANWASRERAARALYNQARHPATSEAVAMRNMQLLDSDLFMDTKVVTEKFDRDELLAHQQRLETQLTALQQSIEELHQGLLQSLREQTQLMQTETQKLQETIANYENWMLAQQAQLSVQTLSSVLLSQTPMKSHTSTKDDSQLVETIAEMVPPIPFVPQGLVKITIKSVLYSAEQVQDYLGY